VVLRGRAKFLLQFCQQLDTALERAEMGFRADRHALQFFLAPRIHKVGKTRVCARDALEHGNLLLGKLHCCLRVPVENHVVDHAGAGIGGGAVHVGQGDFERPGRRLGDEGQR